VGPRAGLDGRKISSTPGFDPGGDLILYHKKQDVFKKCYVYDINHVATYSPKILYENCSQYSCLSFERSKHFRFWSSIST